MQDTQVVAYTPKELLLAQVTVRDWCAANIRRLLAQLKDARENLEQARRSKFRTQPFRATIRKCERRIDYYKKIGKAVKLGYMIVPNFDMRLFAVRSKRRIARSGIRSVHDPHLQNGESLPEGEGRYVSPIPHIEQDMEIVGTGDKQREHWFSYPTEMDEEITFPVGIVKPHIIAETQKAMAQRLFDQIGVAQGGYVHYRQARAKNVDPIVCGRILDRTRAGHAVTFFIAWWLDLETI